MAHFFLQFPILNHLKTALAILLLFFHFSSYGQRANFIGTYDIDRRWPFDTAIYLYLSLDSFKEIKSARIKQGRDFWVQIKSGSWDIDTSNECYYKVTFRFDDGTRDYRFFCGHYQSMPANDSMPDRYSLRTGENIIVKKYGKNGLWNTLKGRIKSVRAGQ